MPTYRYRCDRCGDEPEVWQSFSEEPLSTHDGCGGNLVRVLTPAGIVLKGPGFYKTDSRSGNGKRAGSPKETAKESSGASDGGSKSSGSSDSGSKPESGAKSGSGKSGSGSSGSGESSSASSSSS